MTGRTGRRGFAEGISLGLAATVFWAFYNVGTAIGRADGFSAADLVMLRFGVAALMLAPVLAMRSGWRNALPLRRIVTLTILIGPPFAFFINTGYGIAPLAHAVVIPARRRARSNGWAWRSLQPVSLCRSRSCVGAKASPR